MLYSGLVLALNIVSSPHNQGRSFDLSSNFNVSGRTESVVQSIEREMR